MLISQSLCLSVILCLAAPLSVFSLRCHCNDSWQAFIATLNRDGVIDRSLDPHSAALGQLSCNQGMCEVMDPPCPLGSTCPTDTVPACVRYLTPQGQIHSGCGFKTGESVEENRNSAVMSEYSCTRHSCSGYAKLGLPCDIKTNPYRHILFSYTCTADMCNNRGFHEVCLRA